jgi:hypothetical protein
MGSHCSYCKESLDEHTLDEARECYYKMKLQEVE